MIVMRYLIILLLLLFFIQVKLVAQLSSIKQFPLSKELIVEDPLECGSEVTEEQIELMIITRALRDNMILDIDNFRAAPLDLKIKVHVLRESPSATLVDSDIIESQVDASIQQASDIFAQTGISFSRLGTINYIFESVEDPDGNNIPDIYPKLDKDDDDIISVLESHWVDNAINVFYTPSLINSSNSNLCGNASLPSSYPKPRIIIDTGLNFDNTETTVANSCALNGSSLAHEIGHYFFLFHTQQGPSTSKGIIANELAARGKDSNCGPGVGDELCDTPADPTGLDTGTSFINVFMSATTEYHIKNCASNIPNCTLSHSDMAKQCDYKDSKGYLYKPDPTNVMSYSHSGCRTNFSNGQIERMIKSLIIDRPELLDGSADCLVFTGYDDMHKHNAGEPLETTEASGTIVSEATVEGETIVNANDGANVIYSAGNYISLYPSFEAEYTSTFLAHIEGCEPATNLKTDVLVSSSSVLSGLTVSPNPFSQDAAIEFDLFEDKQLTISVFDIVGNQISTLVKAKQYQAGKHHLPIDGTNLPTGIYYCTIQAGNHIETQKMVLTK